MRVAMRYREEQVLPQLEANCKAGHDLSCRALLFKQGFREEYPLKLSRAELRRGCSGGLWAECDLLIESKVDEDVQFGREIECLYNNLFCSSAGDDYTHDDPERARYLLELGCQAGDRSSCLSLVYAYTHGQLEEPLPGRARELIPFACLGLDDCPGDWLTTK
ncbi:MAG: hypothetical protein AB7T06_08180 [Kofleriaceae bacterium]